MEQTPLNRRYQELALKKLEGTITPEEAIELAGWLNQDDDQPLEVPASFAESRTLHEKRMFQSIEEKITKVVPMRRRIVRMASAAAILLLIMGAVYFYVRPSSNTVTVINERISGSTDVLPGVNKAILTLANGTTIALDSIGGKTIQQGATTILQQGAQLQYKAQQTPATVAFNTLTTPRGGQFQVRLPDGTNVWLNAASSIRYPTAFTGKERRVEITGEVYFEVAPLRLRSGAPGDSGPSTSLRIPFVVATKNMTVEVLGTHFNINAYEDEPVLSTTLLEGSVRVINDGSSMVHLIPGQQARIVHPELVEGATPATAPERSRRGEPIQVQTPDLEKVMAWKNGEFNFNNAGLQEVMRQLERWYDVEIKYETSIPDTKFFGEMSRTMSLSNVLKVLKGAGVRFRMEEGRRIIVSP